MRLVYKAPLTCALAFDIQNLCSVLFHDAQGTY